MSLFVIPYSVLLCGCIFTLHVHVRSHTKYSLVSSCRFVRDLPVAFICSVFVLFSSLSRLSESSLHFFCLVVHFRCHHVCLMFASSFVTGHFAMLRCHCPRCNVIVELESGCNHITCRCKHEFCYVCGLDWPKPANPEQGVTCAGGCDLYQADDVHYSGRIQFVHVGGKWGFLVTDARVGGQQLRQRVFFHHTQVIGNAAFRNGSHVTFYLGAAHAVGRDPQAVRVRVTEY